MLVSLECLYNYCTLCFSIVCFAHVQGMKQMHDGLQACCRYQQNAVYIRNTVILSHSSILSVDLLTYLNSAALSMIWWTISFLRVVDTVVHTPEPQESVAEFLSAGIQREANFHTEGSDHDTHLVLSQKHTAHSTKRMHTSVEAGRCLHLRFRESMGLLLVFQLSSVDSNSFQCCQPTWGATTGLRTT